MTLASDSFVAFTMTMNRISTSYAVPFVGLVDMLLFIYSRTSRPEIDIDLQYSYYSYSFQKRFVISTLHSGGYERITPRAMPAARKRMKATTILRFVVKIDPIGDDEATEILRSQLILLVFDT